MNRIAYLSILLLSMCATNSYAVKCNPGGAQIELNACAAEEFDKADEELNVVYSQLIEKEKGDSKFIEDLRKSQRAWINFRDAELEATFSCSEDNVRICWGSMYPMSYLSYKAKLTKDRTERLKGYIDEERPGVRY
jgi:uncharacterized protein YecT (DUF1311 family)